MKRASARTRSAATGAIAAAAVAATVVLVAAAGGARPPGPPPGPPGPPPLGIVTRNAARLGLDDATLQAIGQIVRESQDRDQVLRDQLRAAHERMHQILSQASPDEPAALAQADAIGALETELHKNRLRAILRIRATLTPEQREELIRIRDEERPDWRRHHGPLGACSRDLRALCADAGSGQAAIACLHDHWADLSERCRDAWSPGSAPPPAPDAAP
jgi:Spy/CpxP family protein refolding chaperone